MRIQHLIDGKAVESNQYFETVNPATQEVLAVVAAGRQAGRDTGGGGQPRCDHGGTESRRGVFRTS